jgi:hypothetical protein
MYTGNPWDASEAYKLREARAERKATERHRYRDLKTPEAKVLTAVITSIMGLFLR